MSEKLYKNCPNCGKALMKNVAVCPGCGKSQFGSWYQVKKVGRAIAVAIAVLIVINFVTSYNDYNELAEAKSQQDRIVLPPDEKAFLDIVNQHREYFRSSSNKIVQSEIRNARAQDLMKSEVTENVSGWHGKIATLDVAGDGAVLLIEVDDDIKIGTWNNRVSDFEDKTLIPRGSEIYMTLMKLNRGDQVRFSGRFLPDEQDYFYESSLTLHGSMTDPEYLFRFSSLTPVE